MLKYYPVTANNGSNLCTDKETNLTRNGRKQRTWNNY